MATASGRKGVVSVAQDDLLEAIGRSTTRVWLSSSFLSHAVAQAVVDRAPKGEAVDRRLLTALTQRSVEAGILDPHALELFRERGWQIRSIPNLHAKAALCDDHEALVGSANLTSGGLGGGNLELGVWLPAGDTRAVLRHLNDWWDKAADIEPVHLQRASRVYRPRGDHRDGWVVGEPLNVTEGERMRASRRLRSTRNGRFWLKAMYHEGRNAPPDWWVHQPWINDAHGRTTDGRIRYTRAGEPARRPSYRRGDLVVLYLVGPSVMPAIYEVVSAPRFDVEHVRAHWPDDAGTYGWVTDVELVLRADLAKAPPLSRTGITGQALQGGKKRLTDAEFQRIRSLIEEASD